MIESVRRMRPRQLLLTGLSFGLIVGSALALWKTLMLVTGAESPVVVVLSGSMEPAFRRGDLLFLYRGPDCTLRAGDVVVYNVDRRQVPIVHRVTKVHEDLTTSDKDARFLTKGDHNRADDRGLYRRGEKWVSKPQVVGRAVASMPYVGMLTIWMNDYPWLKFVLLAVLAFFVLVNRE